MNKNMLFGVPLPAETKTYKPVGHKELFESISNCIEGAGYKIISDRINANDSGQIMTGKLFALTKKDFEEGNDSVQNVIFYQNSYNKKLAVKISFGTHFVTENTTVIHGHVNFKRKHTGNIATELEDLFISAEHFIASDYSAAIRNKYIMQSVEMSSFRAKMLYSHLFVEEAKILNHYQFKELLNFFNAEKNKYKTNLWNWYVRLESKLQDTTALEQMEAYLNIHNFLEDEFAITFNH